MPYKVQAQILASKRQLCIYQDNKDKIADQMLDVDCSKLRLSKANDEYSSNLKLEANQTNEIRSGCPLYYGEELKMEEPVSFRHKRFNPVFDVVNKRVNSKCMDIEDLVKFGKA